MKEFCKIFVVFIVLLNCFNCAFGAAEIPTQSTNKPLVLKVDETNLNNCSEVDSSGRTACQPKSRRKRYVAFPEGSSFSVTFLPNIFENK